jgi:hypothetical protein
MSTDSAIDSYRVVPINADTILVTPKAVSRSEIDPIAAGQSSIGRGRRRDGKKHSPIG